jgi:hypothetical protein
MATTIFVQFTDSTDSSIMSVFAGPQDPAYFPNQGEMPSDDQRYVTYYNNIPQYPESLRANMIKPGD